MNNASIADVAQVLMNNDDFVIIAHISPDADTIGSSLALCIGLESIGKKVVCVCDGDAFDLPDDIFGNVKVHNINEFHCSAKVVIAVDCADAERMGKASEIFDSAEISIVLDHHGSNVGFGQYTIIDPKAAATAEIIYKLVIETGMVLSQQCASLLYCALLGDTGGFSYSNTSSSTLNIASQLLSFKIAGDKIYDFMFRNMKWIKVKVLGYLLTSCERFHNDKMCMAVIQKEKLEELNALETSSEGFVEHLRDIEGVLVSIYIREFHKGAFKVSLRSKDKIDVASIAGEFGGGGHRNAAGFSWNGDIDAIRDQLIDKTREVLG